MRVFGPGAVIASLTIGAGELIFSTRGGALFGSRILQLFTLVLLLKWVLVYSAGRHMVLTGAHPFDVPGFHALWRELEGLDVYVQSLDDFASDVGKVRERYDVVVLYHMVTTTPPEDAEGQPWYQRRHRQAM